MKGYYTRELTILPSMCDAEARLSVPATFALFMDVATEHAELLGVGMNGLMKQGLFWLTVRTKLRFYRRPAMMETVTARTWPEAPERSRCNRDYRLERDGETLVEGKTEWMVMNTQTGRLHPADGVFPKELDLEAARVLEGPFMRMADDFTDTDDFGCYTVRSTDIDLGGHMNNAAYARALAGAFSSEAWREMAVREVEIAFRAPCYEGDRLRIQRRRGADATEVRMSREGRTVLLAQIR